MSTTGALLCCRMEMKGVSFNRLTSNPHPLTSFRWKEMYAGKEHAGEEWTDILGWHQGIVTISGDGKGVFRCPGGSISIWVKVGARGRDGF